MNFRTKYFATSVKGAGIFLPSSKAYKRLSPSISASQNPSTPIASSLSAFNMGGRGDSKIQTPPTPSFNPFSRTVGPGASARERSPDFKPKARPSLPRPESPIRRNPNLITTPQARVSVGGSKLSKSVIGGARYAPSPTSRKLGSSMSGAQIGAGDPGKRSLATPKPGTRNAIAGNMSRAESRGGLRSDSRLGPEPMFDSESDNTPIAASKSGKDHRRMVPVPPSASSQNEELEQLRRRLAERDRQLEQQAADIAEMANSVNELESNNPKHISVATTRSFRGSGVDDLDAPSLRALVREKNERINQLTEEFDSHRADFRDTIDTLEHTSDETNRLYQEKIAGQDAQIREMHERIDRGEDMESVALQLKQLEELVQELEEGLEDARRGEAEARGEVEFLRGEVERGKAELQREKQKTAAALKRMDGHIDGSSSPDMTRELRRKDDEIKGLKAIIQSMGPEDGHDRASPRSGRRLSKHRHNVKTQSDDLGEQLQINEERQIREKLEREVKDLESLVDRKTYREEELEHEIERLRKAKAHVSSNSNLSVSTTRPNSAAHPPITQSRPLPSRNPSIDWEERGVKDNDKNLVGQALASMPETHSDSHSTTMTDSSNLWCDICDAGGHDVLTCTKMFGDPHSDQVKRNGDRIMHNPIEPSRAQRPDDEEGHKLDNRTSLPQHDQDQSGPSSRGAKSGNTEALTPKPSQSGMMPEIIDAKLVAGKASGIADGDKWCGICERDGHDATDCPHEGAF